ncbi:MAG: hypothetical protein V2A56_06020 [bacterium]
MIVFRARMWDERTAGKGFARSIAEREIGVAQADRGATGCKIPDAGAYILKAKRIRPVHADHDIKGETMRKLYSLSSALIMFISVLNIALIGRFFTSLSLPSLWFIGTNFMGILLGLMNFVRIRVNRRDWFITTKTIASNSVCLVFYVLLALQLSSNRSWTAVAVVALMLVASIFWKPVEESKE